MNRRTFVKATCISCVTSGLVPALLTGCQSTHYVSGTVDDVGITVPISEFSYIEKDQTLIHQYILVQNDKLQFPVCLYRLSESEYSALWMKCTHKGAELDVAGDHLHCPRHGSEFTNKGAVRHGPAEHALRTFPVIVKADSVTIDLRQS